MTKRTRGSIIELSDADEEGVEIQVKKPASKKRKINTEKAKMGGLLSKKTKKTTKNDKTVEQTSKPTVNLQPSSKLLDDSLVYDWTSVDYIQDCNGINRSVAQIVVELFDDDNTVPFIARYRRAQTGGLEADQLRLIKQSYDRVTVIKHKADLVIKAIEKVNKWTPEIHNTVKSVRTLNELEHLHALYKTTKRSLAERAREIGLGDIAEAILKGQKIPHLQSLINPTTEGLQDEEKIKNGIVCILADIISKDKQTFDVIKELRDKIIIQIATKKTKDSTTDSKTNKNQKDNDKKYEMYYDWCANEKTIKPHHVLAINRAEAEKIITVQITIPNQFETMLKRSILEINANAVRASPFHKNLITDAFNQAYKKSITTAIIRRTRNELNEKAEEASMEVFAVNVKQLLLTQPVRGKIVLGIDPGFTHGCKLAVVSAQGEVLETTTIYPHVKAAKSHQEAAHKLTTLVRKYQCSILALGNATACRETEVFISNLINTGLLNKQEIDYTIVNEAGASIYSCSPEAKIEFPTMDYNVISAVSIARRLQDPLAELVKVDPKHLGVGMYQHDLPEKQLMTKLNEVS